MTKIVVATILFLMIAFAPLKAQQNSAPASAAQSGSSPVYDFDATIYEVHLPGNRIGRMDMNALALAAASPEAFEKALAELGPALPLFRANQSVRLAGDSIVIGNSVPYVQRSQITAQGQTINTTAYANVGATFDLAGKAGASGSIELDLHMQLSTLSEGTVEVAASVKSPLFRTVVMSRKGTVQPRQPFVVVSMDGASLDATGLATAYIARITLDAPQPPAR